jgi:hypothetical protein
MLEAAEVNNWQYLNNVITRVDTDDIKDAFLETYKNIGLREAFKTFDDMTGTGKARRYAGEIDVLAGWARELEGIVLDVTIPAMGAILTTSQEIFIDTVNQWLLTEGGNLQNVADALRTRFRSLQPWRAWNIARTETLSAMNYGGEMGARQTGYEYLKTWNQYQDNRRRDIHTAVHGTSVMSNEAFYVGGQFLRFPGDPSANAANRVNCRCVLTRKIL